jgi:ABC-2 type transport system permease protein
MSTVTAPLHQSVQTDPITAVPLSRLLHVELRKITDTRAGKWLLFTIGALSAVVVLLQLIFGNKSELTFDNFVGITQTPLALLLPVLGILAITSEWSQRTGLATFTLEPSRSRVVVAKFLAMVLLGLASVVIAFAMAALGNLLGIIIRGGDGSWTYNIGWLSQIALGQVINVTEGLAFGMLFMSSAAAIVIYFVVPIAWSLLFNLVSALNSAAPWVDLGTASSPLFNHNTGGGDWTHLLVASMLWIVLLLFVGATRLLRSEVK